MFVFYCAVLAIFAYIIPALAFFPRLLIHPRLFTLTPIISALIIYLIVSFLLAYGIYQRSSVIFLSLFLIIVAGIRIKKQIQSDKHYWSSSSRIYYVFHALLLLPFFIKLATHGFDRGDEIYSWNFWAIQHYLSIPIDISHTGAPYPQLLPKLLSYCYQLLGDLELQLPVKSLLIVFPYMMLNAIASLLSFNSRRYILFYVLGLMFVLFGCHLSQFFDDGYADPLMASSLVISAVCYWQYHRWMGIRNRYNKPMKRIDSISLSYLFFSYLAAMTAFLSKQPGLLWTGVLSILTIFSLITHNRKTLSSIIIPIILIASLLLAVCLWLLTEGHQFQANQGVIWLSKGERNIFTQLILSSYQYLILQPALLVLFVTTYLMSKKNGLLNKIFWLFLMPAILFWFILGAYQLRLGQHLIIFAWFMVVASHFNGQSFPYAKRLEEFGNPMLNLGVKILDYPKSLTTMLCVLSLSISFMLWYKVCFVEHKHVSLYQGGRLALSRYFGTDSDWIYQNIYKNERLLLWVPSRYLYGLFYPHTQLTTPDYKRYTDYDGQALIDELLRKRPNYVFTVNQAIIDGPAASVLNQLVRQHPDVFEVVAQAPNRYDFVTYRFHHEKLVKQW